MKCLLALLILSSFLSGCATSLSSITEGIRIPFVSDSKDRKSSARDNRGDRQVSPEKPKSPSSYAVRPVQVSAEATDQLDQF